ncbi:MAG: ribonuclease III [Pseudomonadota bacterium]|nr:ribonuclease III [Pseudomonadota bacterium]
MPTIGGYAGIVLVLFYDFNLMDLNYTFKDNALLKLALTHKSVSKDNNERLEFLGDSILNIIISQWLYEQTGLNEGQLSRLRANLVNQNTLYTIGTKLKLAEQINVSLSEKTAKGNEKPSIISDTLEAIFGAIFLDGGFDAAKHVILELYTETLQLPIESLVRKDPKSTLQEYCQKQSWDLPNYEVKEIQGQAHNQIFYVELKINNQTVTGKGKSIKLAEQSAASAMINNLGITHD